MSPVPLTPRRRRPRAQRGLGRRRAATTANTVTAPPGGTNPPATHAARAPPRGLTPLPNTQANDGTSRRQPQPLTRPQFRHRWLDCPKSPVRCGFWGESPESQGALGRAPRDPRASRMRPNREAAPGTSEHASEGVRRPRRGRRQRGPALPNPPQPRRGSNSTAGATQPREHPTAGAELACARKPSAPVSGKAARSTPRSPFPKARRPRVRPRAKAGGRVGCPGCGGTCAAGGGCGQGPRPPTARP